MDSRLFQSLLDPTVFLTVLFFMLVGWYLLQTNKSYRYTPGPKPWPLVVQYLPVDFNSTSHKLSRALDSIGINRECVLRQRIAFLQREKVESLALQLDHGSANSVYIFGSQSEVSTTPDLNSDIDKVFVYNDFNVTEYPDETISGKVNVLMHTSSSIPGYCKLIFMLDDVRLAYEPLVSIVNGFALLRNTCFYNTNPVRSTLLHGPALRFSQHAFICKTWPKSYRHWSSDTTDGHWPTAEMIDFINNSGCFVVPIAHCLSANQELEWRISTSAAERCLMFNLNITQLRCYILLKMILKTFVKSQFPDDTITSYHCKTVLFHCIENSSPKLWTERNLLKCVTVCLCFLLGCLKENNLPNYFNDIADIFLGEFDYQIQNPLVCIVDGLLKSKGEYLKEIRCDDLNSILLRADVRSDYLLILRQQSMNVLYANTLLEYCITVAREVLKCILILKDDSELSAAYARVHTATAVYSKRGVMEYISSCAFLSKLYSHFACIGASRRLEREEEVGTDIECLFKQSMKSDVVSSWLKYASVLLCTGRQEQADIILQQLEKKFYRRNNNYIYVCCCYPEMTRTLSLKKAQALETIIGKEKKNPVLTTVNAAFCVMFTDAEKQCCPKELHYEMFRTITLKDRLSRDEDFHEWMDSGVVDPLPFLFFLKYKVSQYLGNKREKALSLRKLGGCANERQRLPHRATAYNLLGQCWELEHEPEKAFHCYCMSLRDRQTNNSARWHIAALAFSIWRSRRLERNNAVYVLNSQQDGQTIKSQDESTVQYLPVDFNSTSQKLSRAMDIIGINRENVLRYRIAYLQSEKVESLGQQLRMRLDISVYIFGSQSEVSTTPDLEADTDRVYVFNDFNLMEYPDDIRSGKVNFVMDNSSSIPGYCRIMLMVDADKMANYPNISIVNGYAFVRNTWFSDMLFPLPRHGPALTIHGPALTIRGQHNVAAADFVYAFNCKTWPKGYRHWSSDNMDGHWPTAEMIDSINNSGCLVVPTSHCLSENQELEWRISTSAAERCLMFNLNITQLRCYILLKMILKTFIKSQLPDDTITSYHCKNVLFHCIENSCLKLWTERNLLKCVTVCLCFLLDCLKGNHLPNYFNDRADLFLGKFDCQLQDTLVCIVDRLLNSKGEYLKQIDCDCLNLILLEWNVSSDLCFFLRHCGMNILYAKLHLYYCASIVTQVRENIWALPDDSELSDEYARVHTATADYSKLGVMEYISSCAFFSKMCSHFACIAASRRLEREEEVGTATECLFKQSMKSDVVSSRLKYASVLLCTGHHEQADIILQQLEKKLYRSNTNYCYGCWCYPDVIPPLSVMEVFGTVIEKEKKNSYFTTVNAAFCVTFTYAEKQCCPKELQYEMFRTITQKDRISRDKHFHTWMDSGVVDPLPLMYFLKYKVNLHLGNEREKILSLRNLDTCINGHQRLPHRATAYNLLGQCWELEQEPERAFRCYYMSILDRQTNNSARWHIASLVFSIWRFRRWERDNAVDVKTVKQ